MPTNQERTFSSALKTKSASRSRRLRRLQIKYLSTDDLSLNPKNARIHPDKQIKQIAASIEVFGFIHPIAINSEKRVVGGEGKLRAAQRLGLETVPTIELHHLTMAQQMAYAIADNRLSENSQWNETLLAEQIKFLAELDLDFSLEATGFEIGEIDVMIEGLNSSVGKNAEDILPKVNDCTPVSKIGDLWLLNRHRVLCGNSLNESSFRLLMQNRKAAMVFVDPPYNLSIAHHVGGLGSIKHREFAMASGEMTPGEFTNFLTQGFRLLARYSSDGSIHFVCGDWRHLREFLDAGYQTYSELKNLCVWAKDNAGMGSFYRSQHELVFVWKSGEAAHRNNFQLGQFGRYRSNVWAYGGGNSFSRNTDEGNLLEVHPTAKPVAMIADAVMDVSSRNDIVLDSFLGSGSTVIACERTGRTCFGLELDALYVDTIIRRWQKFTGLSATHAASSRSFNDLEKEAIDAARR